MNPIKIRASHFPKAKQSGTALFVALIAIVALSFAGLALIRSVDTTNIIAGNLAFRQGTLHASDVGIENAFNDLATIVVSSLDANYPSGCATGACKYYPIEQAVDTRGVPTVINWSNVPSITVNSDYSVKYVIDRQCQGPAPVTDITGSCSSTSPTGGGSKKAGAPVFSSSQLVYYRVTVQTTGPRNTTSLVQALVLH